MEKNELENLYLELEKYKYIIKKLSDITLSKIETDRFIEKNKSEISEMNIIRKRISTIEWKQMSPEQQQDYQKKYSED